MKATVRNPAIFGPGLGVKSHDTFHAANTRMPYRTISRTLLCDLVQIAGQNFCSEKLDRSVFRKSFQRTKRTVVLGVLNKRNFISKVSIELF